MHHTAAARRRGKTPGPGGINRLIGRCGLFLVFRRRFLRRKTEICGGKVRLFRGTLKRFSSKMDTDLNINKMTQNPNLASVWLSAGFRQRDGRRWSERKFCLFCQSPEAKNFCRPSTQKGGSVLGACLAANHMTLRHTRHMIFAVPTA